MLKIGVTGGIGSGKTTVCRVFAMLGTPVFDADAEAKSLMIIDRQLIQELKKEFGNEIYFSDGQLNRKLLSEKVFNDDAALEKLNSIVHPAVFRAYDEWQKGYLHLPYVIKEAALMYESGSNRMNDYNILVYAPESLRIQRSVTRDGLTEDQVRARMVKQLPEEEKLKLADFVIYNDESRLVVPQVLKLHKQFLLEAGRKVYPG